MDAFRSIEVSDRTGITADRVVELLQFLESHGQIESRGRCGTGKKSALVYCVVVDVEIPFVLDPESTWIECTWQCMRMHCRFEAIDILRTFPANTVSEASVIGLCEEAVSAGLLRTEDKPPDGQSKTVYVMLEDVPLPSPLMEGIDGEGWPKTPYGSHRQGSLERSPRDSNAKVDEGYESKKGQRTGRNSHRQMVRLLDKVQAPKEGKSLARSVKPHAPSRQGLRDVEVRRLIQFFRQKWVEWEWGELESTLAEMRVACDGQLHSCTLSTQEAYWIIQTGLGPTVARRVASHVAAGRDLTGGAVEEGPRRDRHQHSRSSLYLSCVGGNWCMMGVAGRVLRVKACAVRAMESQQAELLCCRLIASDSVSNNARELCIEQRRQLINLAANVQVFARSILRRHLSFSSPKPSDRNDAA